MRTPELLRRWSDLAIPVMAEVPEARRDPLVSRAIAAKSLLSPGASHADLVAMRTRLQRRMPDDLRAILIASNGFVIPSLGSGPALFLNSREIGLFRDCAPARYGAWYAIAGRSDPITQRHVIGGEEHERFELPARDTLHNALLLSSEHSDEILLACPDAFHPSRKTEDWTYCKLSSHGQNIRFGSLFMMLSYLIERSLPAIE